MPPPRMDHEPCAVAEFQGFVALHADDLAQRTAVQHLSKPGEQRRVPQHKARYEEAACTFVGLVDGLQVLQSPGQRLLAEHVFARLHGCYGMFAVQIVGGADQDRVGFGLLEHHAVVCKGRGVGGQRYTLAEGGDVLRIAVAESG